MKRKIDGYRLCKLIAEEVNAMNDDIKLKPDGEVWSADVCVCGFSVPVVTKATSSDYEMLSHSVKVLSDVVRKSKKLKVDEFIESLRAICDKDFVLIALLLSLEATYEKNTHSAVELFEKGNGWA